MLSCLLRVAIIFIPLSFLELLMLLNSFDKFKNIWLFVNIWLLRICAILPLYAPDGVMPTNVISVCLLLQAVLTPIQTLCLIQLFYNKTTPIVKILAIGMFWEAVASIILSISLLSVNIIEGNGQLAIADVYRPFQIVDLLVPVTAGLLFSLIYFKGKRLFHFLRRYQLNYPVVTSCIVIPLYIYGYIAANSPVSQNYTYYYIITLSILMIIALLLFIYMYTINNQRRALRASNQMVNDHYQLLQSRIDDLEHQQNEINAKMAVLVAQNFPEDLTSKYLNDMKTIKDNLYQTLYTHYYMIDAVLSAKARDYQQKGIDFKCQCAGLHLNRLSQIQVAQVLMTLFRYIDQYNHQSVDLKISSHHNQVIIVIDPTCNIGIAGLKHQLSHQISNKMMSIHKKKHTIYLSLTD